MARSIVSIVKGTNVEQMVEEALTHLGGVGALIKRNSTVVVKPNAGHNGPPEASLNTSPALVSAVIKELRKAGPKEIILAEAAAVGCDTMECLKTSGIGKAAEDAGVDRIIDMKTHEDLIHVPIRDARSDLRRISLPRFLIEADHIVNLPIFKSHVSIVFTCALKNIKGVVQDRVHYLMHQTNLADAMMDLWSVVRADLSIADLIRPMEGFGPHSGRPVDFGCIVAGRDPVAVDATVCRMVGMDIRKVGYFEAATRRGLGNSAEKRIKVLGRSIEEVRKPLYLPYLEGFEAWPENHFYVENACSSCQGLTAFTMTKLKLLGEYDKHKGLHILVGRKAKLPDGVRPGKDLVLIGDCLRPLRKKLEGRCLFAAGCPPMESFPYRAIVDQEDQLEPKPGSRARHTRENEILMEKLYGGVK